MRAESRKTRRRAQEQSGARNAGPTQSAVGGTPLYLPPEAFDGAAQTPAFDVWALALVTFEMLAGAHPFAGGTIGDVRRAIASGEGRDVRAWRDDVPAALAETLARALSVDPRERPLTVEAFTTLMVTQ